MNFSVSLKHYKIVFNTTILGQKRFYVPKSVDLKHNCFEQTFFDFPQITEHEAK